MIFCKYCRDCLYEKAKDIYSRRGAENAVRFTGTRRSDFSCEHRQFTPPGLNNCAVNFRWIQPEALLIKAWWVRRSPGELKSKKDPSFRTAFFADPESSFFNRLLDTGSSPVWRILFNSTAVTFHLCSRRGAENAERFTGTRRSDFSCEHRQFTPSGLCH